ncbi:TPA: hypothetical protein ACM6YU_004648, partial [Escherichia coli]
QRCEQFREIPQNSLKLTLIVLPNATRNKKKSNKKQIKLGRLTCYYWSFFIKNGSNIPLLKA